MEQIWFSNAEITIVQDFKTARKAPGQPDPIVHAVTLLEKDLQRIWLVQSPG